MENNKGLRRILSTPWVYEAFQAAVGATRLKKWLVMEAWDLNRVHKLVDIGCGPGSTVTFLGEDVEYWGIDISVDYIEKAKNRFGNRGTFLCGPAEDLADDPRLSNADLVVFNGFLHHIEDANVITVLKSARKILAKHGRAVGLEPGFLRHQPPLSRWVLARDRGQYIRTEQAWRKLVQKVFPHAEVEALTGLLRIPFTHVLIQCGLS